MRQVVKMSSREKIMMYSSVHIWKDARIFFKEAQSLSKKYQVDFYAIGTEGEADQYQTENLTIHLLPKRSRSKRYKNWEILLNAINNSDASYFHYHDPELLLLLPLIRKKKNKKFIYDMHENFPKALRSKDWIPKWLKGPLIFSVDFVEKILLKKNAGVIYAEESYKDEYRSLADKVAACDIYNYPYVPLRQEKVIDAEQEAVQFVYIGRIAVVRGIWQMLYAVEAIAKVNPNGIKLKLIGQCEEKLLLEINHYIVKNNLEDIVCYEPFIEYDKIWDVYDQSDVGLCLLHPTPNYVGSIATKMFEYMAAGLPMLVSNFPLWEQIIDKSKNGLLVDPLNGKSIQKAMEKLIYDSQLRERYSINGKNYFQQTYDWKNEEKKLFEFYEQL
jgi:glycosyltransferase involved in cell wall biosynthesis